MGYHKNKIPKGKLGGFSKIKEEFLELEDAYMQGAEVMAIVELCDLIGAIEAHAKKWNLTLHDLIKMKDLTAAAFKDGNRK